MYCVLAWREPSKTPWIERRQIGPITVQWVWIHRGKHTPKWLLRHRLDKATRWLNSRGITQGVFSPDMAPVGIHPVDSVALRQHLAVALLRRHLQDLAPEQATVALVGGTMTPLFTQTLTQLALQYRHVVLQATGGDEVCSQLRSRYGVAIQCAPTLSQLNRCDGILAFAPLPGLHPHITTYDSAAPLPALQWPEQWPLPPQVSAIQGWSMVAGTDTWQADWEKLAIIHTDL